MQSFGVDPDQMLLEVQNLGIGLISLIILVFLGLLLIFPARSASILWRERNSDKYG